MHKPSKRPLFIMTLTENLHGMTFKGKPDEFLWRRCNCLRFAFNADMNFDWKNIYLNIVFTFTPKK